MDKAPALRRSISLPLLTLYGLGSILGAGIYALVGKVAAEAGIFTPLSFLIAALLAAFTGFTYAELSSRFPKTGAEAIYAEKAFHIRPLSILIGILVATSAIVSSGTLSNAFVGYLQVFVNISRPMATVLTVTAVTAIAIWGIKQSAWTAAVLTLIEVTGLLIIIWVGRNSLGDFPAQFSVAFESFESTLWAGIMVGAFLAFYAFIGFEDMVNVAEEVKNPERNLPIAIISAIIITTIFYSLIAVVAVLSLPVSDLAATEAPLALIYERTTGADPILITFISLFAIVNGIMVQIIMASRILYGLSKRGWLPKFLSYVNPRTRTPVISTVLIGVIILMLALSISLIHLAETTSFVILTVFALMNLGLIIIKIRDPHPKKAKTFPIIIPILGFLTITAFITFRVYLYLGQFL